MAPRCCTLSLVACLALGLASASAAVPKPEDAITWVMAEPVQDEAQLQMALSVQPDAILRGWFKWWSAPDWQRFSPVAKEAEKRNILFGGGVTCSALQERENGLTRERFLALVARNPRNEPAVFYSNTASGCFHGAIEKKEYLDYVLGWAFKQVDAGATMLSWTK